MTLNFLLIVFIIFSSIGCDENKVKPDSHKTEKTDTKSSENTKPGKTVGSKEGLDLASSSPHSEAEVQKENQTVVTAQVDGALPKEQQAALDRPEDLQDPKSVPKAEEQPVLESQTVSGTGEKPSAPDSESQVKTQPAEVASKKSPPFTVEQEKETKVDVCSFPNSLSSVLVTKLNKHCSFITYDDLTQIKNLKITGITQEESLLLTNDFSSHFTSLEELDISNNPEMTSLPSFVTHVFGLKKLNISRTGIENFDEDICQLQELVELVASHNNYEENKTPFNTFCLENLKVLDMSHSSLRHIDEYIYHLVNLEELYMNNNDLPRVPFMLHLMTYHLLLVDLRNNSYIPEPNMFTTFIGYESVEDLHNCKNTQPFSEERSECRTQMHENFHCEWWYEYPFEEKRPFRRYKEMTDEEYAAFSAQKEPGKDRCYLYWLNTHYMELSEAGRRAYLEHTINGRTRRELRLLYWGMDNYWMDLYGLKAALSYCMGIRMLYSDTTYAPSSHEVDVEDYYTGDWNTLPSECEHDRHLYPKHRNESQ